MLKCEGWTHLLCDSCWTRLYGDRQPYRVVEEEDGKCCTCGEITQSGIWIRKEPHT